MAQSILVTLAGGSNNQAALTVSRIYDAKLTNGGSGPVIIRYGDASNLQNVTCDVPANLADYITLANA